MQIDLTGKTALVTGSTAGIGLAIVRGLVRAGAKVIINGRTRERVDKAVTSIEDEFPGASIKGIAADLGTAEGCDALVADAPDVDILVNNLGIFDLADFYKIPDSEWQRFFDVNVMAGVRLARAYTPAMVENQWGRVIFISSESGLNIPPEMLHYGFTKTANLSFSRGLAKRLAGTGVTVNAVLPGPTLSEGVSGMLARNKNADQSVEEAGAEFVKSARPSSILQRPATVEEVANMVVYAVSPQASATTGAALRVDGGVVDSIA